MSACAHTHAARRQHRKMEYTLFGKKGTRDFKFLSCVCTRARLPYKSPHRRICAQSCRAPRCTPYVAVRGCCARDVISRRELSISRMPAHAGSFHTCIYVCVQKSLPNGIIFTPFGERCERTLCAPGLYDYYYLLSVSARARLAAEQNHARTKAPVCNGLSLCSVCVGSMGWTIYRTARAHEQYLCIRIYISDSQCASHALIVYSSIHKVLYSCP